MADAPVFKKRAKNTNLRKRAATPPSDDSDYTDDEEGTKIKRRRKEGVTVTGNGLTRPQDLSKSDAFQADRTSTITDSNDATRASKWYTDAALAAKDAGSTKPPREDAGVTESSDTYQGTAKYTSFIQKNPESKQFGPVKQAPTNVRAVITTDFAPDVCKDYKQTGFCGFGDSCKFLHAREDYAQGWQLDKEWEKAGKKDKNKQKDSKEDADLDEEEKMLKTIPFACVICKEDYKRPIMTKCGHYFCEKCAMNRYQKEKKKSCAACGADTNGSFGMAKKLDGLLERKKKREEERAEKEEA